MAKKRKKSKVLTKQQKRFKRFSKECHKEPTKQKYSKCMSRNLKNED